MTDAISSFGTFIKMGDGGAPESFTTVAEVLDINGPNLSWSTHNATTHDSSDTYSEILVGIKSGGEVTFTVHLVPANATHDENTGLIYEFEEGNLKNWELVFPDAGSHQDAFAAYVTGLSKAAPVDGKLTMDVTLGLSGKSTFSA